MSELPGWVDQVDLAVRFLRELDREARARVIQAANYTFCQWCGRELGLYACRCSEPPTCDLC